MLCENLLLAYAKTKALISCVVTAQLISAFVFATSLLFTVVSEDRFSHDVAPIKSTRDVKRRSDLKNKKITPLIYTVLYNYIKSMLRASVLYHYLESPFNMSRVARKPVFGVSDQDRHKQVVRQESSDFDRRGIVLSM